jgi:hypothetical protein
MLEISSELRSVEMEVIIIVRAAVLFMLAIWHNNPLPCCGNQHYCYETLCQIRKYTAKFYFKEIPNEVPLQGDTESGFYCKQIQSEVLLQGDTELGFCCKEMKNQASIATRYGVSFRCKGETE